MRSKALVLVLSLFVSMLAAAAEVDNLARDLKSRDVDTRVRAAESLGNLHTAAAVGLLTQALSDREARVRAAAARGLWDSSDVGKSAIPALRNALGDSDTYVVASAAGALIAMDVPQKEVAGALRGVLQRGDPYDRFLAARLLIGAEPASNLVAPITDYLRMNLPDARRDAGSAIDRSENFDSAAKELISLGQTQDRTQIAPLMTILRDAPDPMIPPILDGLGQLKTPPDHWVDMLIVDLGSRSSSVRQKAVELVGKQKSAADIRKWAPAVAHLTTDPDAGVRGWVLSTLKEGKGLAHAAFSAVLQMVRSERDDGLRARAAEAVGEIGDAKYAIEPEVKSAMGNEALPVLSTAIASDPVADVRSNALQSLARLRIESSKVVPVLARAAVEGKSMGFRTDALVRIGNLGSDAALAAPALEPLTRDPDPEVARIARATLESIRRSPTNSARKETAVAKTPAVAKAPADPAARERGLAFLREHDAEFAEWDFARAITHHEEELVKAFLDAGMMPSAPLKSGTLPLQLAIGSDRSCGAEVKSMVRLLLDRGADAAGTDNNGNTVLMGAAEQCDSEMIRMLIKAGAKAGARNPMGFTALDAAISNGNTSAGEALIAGGARLNAERAKTYREEYKTKPKVLELIAKASSK